MVKFFFVLALSVFCLRQTAGQEVDLGGFRSVLAEITRQDGGYSIRIDMISVQLFSPAANKTVNSQLAAIYSLNALAKMLNKKQLSAEEHSMVSYKMADGRFIAVFDTRGISSKVQVSSRNTENVMPQNSLTSIKLDDDLFSKKADWLYIVRAFFDHLSNEIEQANQEPGKKARDQMVAAVEKQLVEGSKLILKQVENDLQLFSHERESILPLLSRLQKQLYVNLTKVSNKSEDFPTPDKYFTNIRIKPKYKDYLLSQHMLMKAGGTKAIRTGKGKYLLVSVGSAPVKGLTPRHRINQKRVARAKAIAELLKRKGVEVSTVSVTKEKLHIENNGGKQEIVENIAQYFNLNQEEASGVIRSLPEIGSWYSWDTKMYFIALGKFFTVSKRK